MGGLEDSPASYQVREVVLQLCACFEGAGIERGGALRAIALVTGSARRASPATVFQVRRHRRDANLERRGNAGGK